MGRQLSCKKSHLMIGKILRPFVNTLSAVDKYSLLNTYNLTHPIKIQLSQNQKTCSQFFSAFSKSSLNFHNFEKNDAPHT